jgi:putative FmdB family regulatory protein
MPIHEYTCRDCGHAFEALLYGSEKASCPKCSSAALDKRLSTFAVSGGSGASPGTGSFGDMPPGCGTCGDPRGPGACSMN